MSHSRSIRGVVGLKVLVVLTNSEYYDRAHKYASGLWLAEATDFVDVVEQAGLEVDYVSPQGGVVPIDPMSLHWLLTNRSTLNRYQSVQFQDRALTYSLNPVQVKARDYVAIYYTGGHGVLADFKDNPALKQVAEEIHQRGGYLCSVCHGLAGLLNLQNSDGSYLLQGRRATGFTTREEKLMGKAQAVPYHVEQIARERGCNFRRGIPFTPFALKDGRIITGQNPMSSHYVARLLVRSLGKK